MIFVIIYSAFNVFLDPFIEKEWFYKTPKSVYQFVPSAVPFCWYSIYSVASSINFILDHVEYFQLFTELITDESKSEKSNGYTSNTKGK